MSLRIPHIPLNIDQEKFYSELKNHGVEKNCREALFENLPSLTFAERVLWAVTGIKKCSSLDITIDVQEGRGLEKEILSMFDVCNLKYKKYENCYPEPVISQKNWEIDEDKASLELPYRKRDKELARWFDYPSCCVKGYREYFDQMYSDLLTNFHFKGITSVEELDDYAYPNDKKDITKFREVGTHIKSIGAKHPELIINRKGLITPIRNDMAKIYDDPSYHLLLHFCLPVHNYECSKFQSQASNMYTILRDAISENYANLVVARTILMDEYSNCF